MIKYYDQTNKRLVYCGKKSDSNFWDQHWAGIDIEKNITAYDPFIVKWTKRYLQPGSSILEGGCGIGNRLFSLDSAGFDAHGVDYAENTVAKIQKIAPQLNASLQDIRQLNFEDASFDGYWSLGVIEHFQNGYKPILQEMKRVIKKGGYLFVTVPAMSLLRRSKAVLGCYPKVNDSEYTYQNFYQFALNKQVLIDDMKAFSFKLLQCSPIDGLKGLKDEVSIGKNMLQKLYSGHSFLTSTIRAILDLFVRYWGYHMLLFVFMNEKAENPFPPAPDKSANRT